MKLKMSGKKDFLQWFESNNYALFAAFHVNRPSSRLNKKTAQEMISYTKRAWSILAWNDERKTKIELPLSKTKGKIVYLHLRAEIPTLESFSSLIEFSLWLWLWLWFVWVTVVQGPPAAVDCAPKQQKNDEKMFRFRGFLEIEPGTAM